jgi:hypothetical protein
MAFCHGTTAETSNKACCFAQNGAKGRFLDWQEGDLSDFNMGHCNLCISRSLPEM